MNTVQNKSSEVAPKERAKPGPVPQGGARYNVILPPDLGEWGKHQPGGLSETIRRAMKDLKESTDRPAAGH